MADTGHTDSPNTPGLPDQAKHTPPTSAQSTWPSLGHASKLPHPPPPPPQPPPQHWWHETTATTLTNSPHGPRTHSNSTPALDGYTECEDVITGYNILTTSPSDPHHTHCHASSGHHAPIPGLDDSLEEMELGAVAPSSSQAAPGFTELVSVKDRCGSSGGTEVVSCGAFESWNKPSPAGFKFSLSTSSSQSELADTQQPSSHFPAQPTTSTMQHTPWKQREPFSLPSLIAADTTNTVPPLGEGFLDMQYHPPTTFPSFSFDSGSFGAHSNADKLAQRPFAFANSAGQGSALSGYQLFNNNSGHSHLPRPHNHHAPLIEKQGGVDPPRSLTTKHWTSGELLSCQRGKEPAMSGSSLYNPPPPPPSPPPATGLPDEGLLIPCSSKVISSQVVRKPLPLPPYSSGSTITTSTATKHQPVKALDLGLDSERDRHVKLQSNDRILAGGGGWRGEGGFGVGNSGGSGGEIVRSKYFPVEGSSSTASGRCGRMISSSVVGVAGFGLGSVKRDPRESVAYSRPASIRQSEMHGKIQ